MMLIDQVRNDCLADFDVFQQLKKKGVLFSEMFTYAPYTLASLHAIFSGLYGSHNGVNAYYKACSFKKEACHTLFQYLNEAGYYTQADTFSSIFVPQQGLDKFAVYDEHNVDLLERHSQILTDLSKLDQNFCVFLHQGTIHRDVVKNVIRQYSDFDKNYFGHYEQNRKQYYGYIKEAEAYLSAMFKKIEDLALGTNSIIVVFTDHGGGLGEKPGEKAYGIYTYDYSIKTWAYFMQPKILPQDQEVKALSRTIDIMPTILDLLGLKPSKKHLPLQGKSLLPILAGKEQEGRLAFVETSGLEGPTPSPNEPNVKCVRTKEWKLIFNTTTQKKELYNLLADPAENVNVFGQHPNIEAKLWSVLSGYHNSQTSVNKAEIIERELKKLGYLP